MPGGAYVKIQALDPSVPEWSSSAELKYLTGHQIGHRVLQSLVPGLTIDNWPVMSMRLQTSSGESASAVIKRLASGDSQRVLRSSHKRRAGS